MEIPQPGNEMYAFSAKNFRKEEQTDSVEYYLQLGNELLKEIPSNSIPAIGFIQVRASTEMSRKTIQKHYKIFCGYEKEISGVNPRHC